MWNFNKFQDNTAVILPDGREVSYPELQRLSDSLGAKIADRSLIFNLCSNTLGSLLGYVSALEHRNVPLMLDEHIALEVVNGFIDEYRPDYLWLPVSRREDFAGTVIYETEGYVLLRTGFNREYQLHDDLALLLTTSGSVGSPKFVRQSYKNIAANTASIVEYLHLDTAERAITSLPMNYTFGISVINSHLMVGATLVLSPYTIMQREFWTLMSEQKVTSLSGVPYTYEMLDKLRFMRRDLPDLHTLTQAGGKLSPELHQKFAEYAQAQGKNFVVMYGQTEATARMSYLPPELSLTKVGSMGIAVPGGKFSLIDADNQQIIEPGVVGELVYEGDNVTLGYAQSRGDLAKGDEFGGRLLTGDMARFDEDGFFYVVGRKKRFLKIFGNRVNLDETERLIKSHFCDLDCACAGQDDAMCIYVTNQQRLKEVQNFVAETSKINFVAFKVKYLAEIPKNEAGKTLYKELDKIA